MGRKRSGPVLAVVASAFVLAACAAEAKRTHGVTKIPSSADLLTATPGERVAHVAAGYRLEAFARGLDLPAAIAFDDKGNAYVVEAGGLSGLNAARTPPRIVRLAPSGEATPIELKGEHVAFPATGICWAGGSLYVSHRDEHRDGVVSRVDPDGTVTAVLRGLPSRGDHGTNQIIAGPDGKLYLSQGTATNSGVVGLDDFQAFGWPEVDPAVHDVPAKSLILSGRDFLTDDPRGQSLDRKAVTGSFRAFGVACEKGDEAPGNVRCNGSILRCDPDGGALEVYAWGLRPFGLAFAPEGRLYATCQGMDLRGSRPIAGDVDALLRVRQDQWYGWPDFATDLRPLLDDERHAPPARLGLIAEPIVDLGRTAVSTPSPRDLAARLPVRSGACGLAFAPMSFGRFGGKIFVAAHGSLAPDAASSWEAGYRVLAVDEEGHQTTFLENDEPGPASRVGALGRGLERPIDVKFGPDGALYVVDLGVVVTGVDRRTGFQFQAREGTGTVWRVTPFEASVGAEQHP